MATTMNMIRRWFVEGVKDKNAYMAVWCDTYDYEDYPAYYNSRREAQHAINNPSSMQKVMEVYALTSDRQVREAQIQSHRSWALRIGDQVDDSIEIGDVTA